MVHAQARRRVTNMPTPSDLHRIIRRLGTPPGSEPVPNKAAGPQRALAFVVVIGTEQKSSDWLGKDRWAEQRQHLTTADSSGELTTVQVRKVD